MVIILFQSIPFMKTEFTLADPTNKDFSNPLALRSIYTLASSAMVDIDLILNLLNDAFSIFYFSRGRD